MQKGGKIPGNPLGGPPRISIFGITPPRQLTNYTLTQQNHCESQKLSCLAWRFAHIYLVQLSAPM